MDVDPQSTDAGAKHSIDEKDLDMEDHELISAAKNNDLEAFNQLILKYQKRIFNHAYQFLECYSAAEDIMQEAFILAFRKISQFREGSFLAWLLRITTNLCLDEFRAAKRAALIPFELIDDDGETIESPFWVEDPSMRLEESVETKELRAHLEHGLIRLPIYYQRAVSLVDIQQLSYKEAPAVMQISIGTLKSRLKRGRNQLRNDLINHQAANFSEISILNHSAS